MKNTGFAAWKARLDWFNGEFPFGPFQRFTNEEGRLHRDDGPAMITPTRVTWYRNGRRHGMDADKFGTIYYYYDNIRVPPHYVTKPESLTLAEVFGNPNAEVRYVGMRAIGMDKVMEDKAVRVIHTDAKKGQVLFEISGILKKPLRYVQVVNSTAEPDGTYKKYYLCVPPNVRTCKSAVAWTFGMAGKEYAPQQET